MKRKIVELIIIVILIAIQNSLGRVISLGGVMPNFMILLPVIFGYINGSKEGIFTGFFAGLAYDAYSANVLVILPCVFLLLDISLVCFI